MTAWNTAVDLPAEAVSQWSRGRVYTAQCLCTVLLKTSLSMILQVTTGVDTEHNSTKIAL